MLSILRCEQMNVGGGGVLHCARYHPRSGEEGQRQRHGTPRGKQHRIITRLLFFPPRKFFTRYRRPPPICRRLPIHLDSRICQTRNTTVQDFGSRVTARCSMSCRVPCRCLCPSPDITRIPHAARYCVPTHLFPLCCILNTRPANAN